MGTTTTPAMTAAPIRNNPLGPVLAPQDDLVAFPDAALGKPARESARRACHLGVGVPPHPITVVIDEEVAAMAFEIAK